MVVGLWSRCEAWLCSYLLSLPPLLAWGPVEGGWAVVARSSRVVTSWEVSALRLPCLVVVLASRVVRWVAMLGSHLPWVQ